MQFYNYENVYNKLEGQPHLQELITQPLLHELDVEMKDEADSNRAEVIAEINDIIKQMRNIPYSNYLFNGSTNTGSYILYIYL